MRNPPSRIYRLRRAVPVLALLFLPLSTLPAGNASAAVRAAGFPPAGVVPTAREAARTELDGMLGRGIHHAVLEGDVGTVAILLSRMPGSLESRNANGFTPLHVAVLSNRLEMTRFLVGKGARVDSRSGDGKGIGATPLHLATVRGAEGVVEYLLSIGADANARDRNGVTPLHMSAFLGNAGIAARLMERCADVNVREVEGLTPLHIASDMGAGEVVRMLLSHGADASARDTHGRTAQSLAQRKGNRGIDEMIRRAADHLPADSGTVGTWRCPRGN